MLCLFARVEHTRTHVWPLPPSCTSHHHRTHNAQTPQTAHQDALASLQAQLVQAQAAEQAAHERAAATEAAAAEAQAQLEELQAAAASLEGQLSEFCEGTRMPLALGLSRGRCTRSLAGTELSSL
jgi:acyl-CoA reductase-like NAD-dependent aldehyde dehydrogenase